MGAGRAAPRTAAAQTGSGSAVRRRQEREAEPPRRRGLVPRPGLVNRLRAAHGVDLVVVTAPAGYGKTALLDDWAERDGRAFVRLAAARDEDAGTFSQRLADAVVGSVRPGGRRLSQAAATTAERTICEAARLVAASATPVVVVVDDVHLLDGADACLLLVRLADELPAGSQLAVAGRSAGALPIARWRASGRLFELATDDLRFTNREAGALFRGAGVLIAQRHLDALGRMLEGWPAGLQLAALALRSPSVDIDALLDKGLAPALDYLRAEVLSALPEQDLEFLTRASVLDRMCAGLCDAVVGTSHSARMLDRFEHANLFVAPIDRERRWYRIHSLLRESLHAELERREPGASAGLHRRAAAWCAAHGETELALEHARAGHDVERLLDVIEQHAAPFLPGARGSIVAHWLAPLDDEAILRRRPKAAGIGALSWALLGRAEEAERWLAAAESQGLPVQLHALAAPRSAADLRRAADQALSSLELGSSWRAPLLVVLGWAYALEGNAPAADAALEEAGDAAAVADDRAVEAIALAQRCLVATGAAEWGRADLLAEAARAALERADLEEHGASAFALAASARTALRHGDWVTLRRDLERSKEVLPHVTHVLAFASVALRLQFARVHLALGDGSAARALLGEIEQVYERRPQLGVLADDVAALRADLDRTDREMATLTAAELRLLPLLTTHLSFREIAERLFVSRNTVKTQAISVYRKLGVSSRGEAIGRASGLGLVAADLHADAP
jgi:LuxR family maltose regulon positive regulatory protein